MDIAIAVDMLRLAHTDAYDTAILVSGDRDFVKAAQAVQDFGKHVENAYFQRGGSRHLREAADRFILLDKKSLKGCWLRA